jgi:hypothetical protein
MDEYAGTRTRHLLEFLQNDSFPARLKFVAFPLTLQHEQLFGPGAGNAATSAARIFSIAVISEKFP